MFSYLCASYINKINLLNELHRKRVAKRRNKFRRDLLRKLNMNFQFQSENIGRTLQVFIKNSLPKTRKLWMKKRSDHWWENIFMSENFDEMFQNFRMWKATFNYICQKLSAELKPKHNTVRKPISVEKKVAISLYKLASCAENRVIGNQFGVHKSTVRKCLLQFCQAVNKVLLCEEIKLPNAEEAQHIASVFEDRTGLPQVIGAIDGTHIPILPKSDGYRDFINRKGWTSLVLQAVVDCHYLFRDITIQHPGCTHDAAVLKDSQLYKSSDQLQWPSATISGKEVSAYIIGDPAYPLLPWLMKNYAAAATAEEDSLNAYFSKARIVVENAFGRLKGRWRILQKRIDMDVRHIPMVVATCCVLHNILERQKIPYNAMLNEDLRQADVTYEQPSQSESATTIPGEENREFLKCYMSAHFPLLTRANT